MCWIVIIFLIGGSMSIVMILIHNVYFCATHVFKILCDFINRFILLHLNFFPFWEFLKATPPKTSGDFKEVEHFFVIDKILY